MASKQRQNNDDSLLSHQKYRVVCRSQALDDSDHFIYVDIKILGVKTKLIPIEICMLILRD